MKNGLQMGQFSSQFSARVLVIAQNLLDNVPDTAYSCYINEAGAWLNVFPLSSAGT